MDIRGFLSVVVYILVENNKESKMGDSRKRELNLGGRDTQ